MTSHSLEQEQQPSASRSPGWMWALAGVVGLVAAWGNVVQAAPHHPQGLVGALIPPGMAVLAVLWAMVLQSKPDPVYAALRWKMVVWGILAFCLFQAAHGAWQSTGSVGVVFLVCASTLPMTPALVLVTLTLDSMKQHTRT